MSNGADKDYNGREKNHWRRWQWNRIVENLKATNRRPQNAIVLYLAGIENLDMQEAMRRGFMKENMIAVDKVGKVVDALRASGTLAICSDLNSALWSFPLNLKLDVVVADFCAGIQVDQWSAVHALTLIGQAEDCILSVNLQRGRDPESGEAREAMQSSDRFKKYASSIGLSDKHRGLLLHQIQWNNFWSRMNKTIHEKLGEMDVAFWDRVKIKHQKYGESKGLPAFSSYRSRTISESGRETAVFFDSAVYRPPTTSSYTRFVSGKAVEIESTDSFKNLREHLNKTVKSLTAISAVRTKRINEFARN